MSKSAELSRKEMKQPDQFQVAAVEAASWLTGHRRQSLLIGGVVVVALLAALAVLGWRERRSTGAAALLSEVYRTAGGEISAVPLPGVPGPFFPSDAARQRAVAEAADRLLAGYGGTTQATLAALAKGDAHLRLGEFDAAAAAYQLYLASARRSDSFRFAALEGLALAAEGKGDGAGALAGWARLAAEVPQQADRADLERARLLAAAGNVEEAKGLLVPFSDRHKGSALAGEAAERLARLGGR
jgi:predicted negative regulator of RcsB-dependent stress response